MKGVAEGEGSKKVVFLEGATSQSTSEGGGWGVREQGQELRSDFEEVRNGRGKPERKNKRQEGRVRRFIEASTRVRGIYSFLEMLESP